MPTGGLGPASAGSVFRGSSVHAPAKWGRVRSNSGSLSGRLCHLDAHRPLRGVGTSVEGAIGPGALDPVRGTAPGLLAPDFVALLLRLRPCGDRTAPVGRPAGDFRGSVANASPPCCGAEGGPLLGFTPPLPLDGALYCQQGLACYLAPTDGSELFGVGFVRVSQPAASSKLENPLSTILWKYPER
jgi:hypothetical protein